MAEGTAGDGPVVSLRRAAELLDVHYMTAYRYVRTGVLAATKVGSEWQVRVEDVSALADPTPAVEGGGGHRTAHAWKRLRGRLVAGDEAGAWKVIETAMVGGLDPREVLTDLMVPALASIGEGWAAGEVTIAEEHRASAVTQRIIGRLGPRFARRGRKRGTIMVGAVQGDQHSIPSSILADILRGAGYGVCDLGANCPVDTVVAMAVATPHLVAVCLSVTATDVSASAPVTTAALRRALGPGVVILVGGGAVPDAETAARLGSDGFAPDADAALALVDDLVSCAGVSAPT